MAMTSRQRVRRAVEFDNPDRPPRDLWLLPAARIRWGDAAIDDFQRRWPTDFAAAPGPDPVALGLAAGDRYAAGIYRDEWGCEFVNIQPGVIGEVKKPRLDDWSKLDDLSPPAALLDVDTDRVNRFCAECDRFVLAGCCPRPFEQAQFLRGSENLYVDLAEDRVELHALLRMLHEFYLRQLEAWARTAVDALYFMDDWGSQRAMLIAPEQWRRIFKPLYADYARIARDHGKKLFMHSDGWIFDIYEDLMEIGVDAVNSQLFCMDIEEIGRRFRGRITFWGELDRQRIMNRGTADEVRAAVRRVVDALYLPAGGVVAQFELGAGTLIANADAAFRAWDELTRR